MSGFSPSRVVILTDFASVRGGASGLALRQAELMAKRGLDVVLIAGDRGGTMPDGVTLVSLGGAKLLEAGALRAATRGLWDAGVARHVSEWIKNNDTKSTLYHLHGLQQTLSPSVLAPLALVADRLVIHAHDYFLACPNGAFFDYQANEICGRVPMSTSCLTRHCDKKSRAQKLWRVSRQAVQNRGLNRLLPAATVVLLRPEMADWLRLAGDVVAIPNPAEGFDLSVAAPENRRGFIYIGDLNHYKGVLLLAEAARQAKVRLTFVGDGAERQRLAEGWPEHRITGWQDRAGIAAELSQARALIAPSLGPEPFGLAPVEALLSGVPVVLADAMLIASQINAMRAGIEFRAGELSSLTAALTKIDADDGFVSELAGNAKQAGAALSLSFDKWIDELLSIYLRKLQGLARSLAGNYDTIAAE